MRRLIVLCAVWLGLLGSCSPTLKPTIKVTNAGQTMTITGKGFSTGVAACAQLSLLGLPAPDQVVTIKPQPVCATTGPSSGTFTTNYSYNYLCEPSTTHSVLVVAVDTSQLNPAFTETSIAWGPKCAIAGVPWWLYDRRCRWRRHLRTLWNRRATGLQSARANGFLSEWILPELGGRASGLHGDVWHDK